jgi:hypothetical protein
MYVSPQLTRYASVPPVIRRVKAEEAQAQSWFQRVPKRPWTPANTHHSTTNICANMFHEGSLQSGIALAIQQQKLVACFVRGTSGRSIGMWREY